MVSPCLFSLSSFVTHLLSLSLSLYLSLCFSLTLSLFVVVSNLEMEATSPVVIYDKEDSTYKKLEKERVDWLEAFCETEHCIQTNDDVLNKAAKEVSNRSIDSETLADEDIIILKERAKKKRKMTRKLREFTGVTSLGERKHKGWSDEGMVTFETYVKTIWKDVEDDKYVDWEQAYREVMEKLGNTKKPAYVDQDQVGKYEPNLSVVYEGF